MSRNRYPEETYHLILNVAQELFMSKGYEKTSLQDIIDGLGGLTKGAIYHHFKSKEDILIAVVNNICSNNNDLMAAIRDDTSLTGKERLEKMFIVSLENPTQQKLFTITPNLLDNPTFLSFYIKNVFEDTIPFYIVPLLREAVADGSIKTDYPDELAELILFLGDIWLNPLIFRMTSEKIISKAQLLNQLLKPFDITIFNDKTMSILAEFRKTSD